MLFLMVLGCDYKEYLTSIARKAKLSGLDAMGS